MIRLRLTVRTRLTLLYTALFTLCGTVVTAASYALAKPLGSRPGSAA